MLGPGGEVPSALVFRALDEADGFIGGDEAEAACDDFFAADVGDLGGGGRAVAIEPLRLLLAGGNLAGEGDLEGALAEGEGHGVGAAVGEGLGGEAVEGVNLPIEVFLNADHAG